MASSHRPGTVQKKPPRFPGEPVVEAVGVASLGAQGAAQAGRQQA
ncbi:hypothetical protein [Kerstersia similis]